MPMGFDGDEDPIFRDEPEHCRKCDDLLEEDLWGDWFCPTCTKEQAEKEVQ